MTTVNETVNQPVQDLGSALKAKKKRLGEELVYRGLVTDDQVGIALKEQKRLDKPLGEALIALGFISETKMRDALAEMLDRESVDLTAAVPDVDAIKLIPKEYAIRFNVVPLSYDEENNRLSIAMKDVFDLGVLDRIRVLVGSRTELITFLASEGELRTAIDQFYGYELSVDGILKEIETGEVDYSGLDAGGEEYSQPLIRLVDAILGDAVKKSASDIHFEPEESFLRLRYRIDGVLRQVRSVHKEFWSSILVRLKVMQS